MNDATDNENAEDENLILVFMPSLLALLQRVEELKSAPLSESEVLRIRDGGVCIALRASVAQAMEEKRGYADLDAENAWREWRKFRSQNSD